MQLLQRRPHVTQLAKTQMWSVSKINKNFIWNLQKLSTQIVLIKLGMAAKDFAQHL